MTAHWAQINMALSQNILHQFPVCVGLRNDFTGFTIWSKQSHVRDEESYDNQRNVYNHHQGYRVEHEVGKCNLHRRSGKSPAKDTYIKLGI